MIACEPTHTWDEFIEHPEVLLSPHVGLVVELVEVDQRGENDPHLPVVLRVSRALFQLDRDVSGNDVVQEPVRLQMQVKKIKYKLEEIQQCKLKISTRSKLKKIPKYCNVN